MGTCFSNRDRSSVVQRDERQRQHGGRENHVRDEDREIDDPDRSLSRERLRTDVVVVDEVAREKQCRRRERRQHEAPVRLDSMPANHDVAARQQHRGDGVERGVDSRQLGNHWQC